jgi:hypothetical protein
MLKERILVNLKISATFLIVSIFPGNHLFAQDSLLKIGDIFDGNRSTPVHRIQLIDQDSSVIYPDEQPLLPFSTYQTCNPCHDYNKISHGWHFNAGDSGVADGRPGQPWIYSDPHSGTQIPVSLRRWPGTYSPSDLGLDEFDFLTAFGRHYPGGGHGDNPEQYSNEKLTRWRVSGALEVNCLACHDAEPGYDAAEYAAQVSRQNFRWAATAATAFAEVRGSARDMPDNYDLYWGISPDGSKVQAPQVTYDERRFNGKGQVFLDLTRRVKSDRCYFCHSTKIIDPGRPERWQFEEDVHLKAGMTCVDCHRNGLDHQMIRGYEGESADTNHPAHQSFSCRGCHLGTEEGNRQTSGRLGALKPEHKGIPPVHFDMLSCTACHSGNWPGESALTAKTAQAHGLGMHQAAISDRALPHIYSMVFMEQKSGQIAPQHLVWPSFWAELRQDTLRPLPLAFMLPVTRNMIAYFDSTRSGDWPTLADSQVTAVLDSLNEIIPDKAKVVYVSSGRIYRLDDKKRLKSSWSEAARPYAWPIAHDVRPAAQALGVNGCSDCHSASSDFFFGKLPLDSPLQKLHGDYLRLNNLENINPAYAWLFSMTFMVRPWFKLIVLICSLVITLIVTLYLFRGLNRLIRFIAWRDALNG